MLLYLTSIAAQTLDKFLPHIPQYHKGMSVAFIPTAAAVYKESPWVDNDRKALEEMGFAVTTIDIKDKTENDLRPLLTQVDIIFVAGGNTFYLLEHVRKSGFDVIVKELIAKDTIYIGSSAGAVLVGPSIEPVKVFDDPKVAHISTFEGLNIVPFIVLPHYSSDDIAYKNVVDAYKDQYTFILLANNQAVLVTELGHEVIS